ncbi:MULTISPECIES: MarR family transcriptional regulator [unclassified Burkholderia]|uniref:MarR family winged helix-turn-helix transcriptional regulator n=1 Tax=unclassified Burkholderia TaxID=2613784 RepID=UPI0007566E03|nr:MULTISPECIES: MarR family transcriptional regulator [unclassified Burkholderia]KVN03432.1 MarR family transcriptional regulator [Burkholderia sp. MSMB1552]KWZ55863.1 MarR family transcriptional regulator [Burkholderia sp. MSMB1588]
MPAAPSAPRAPKSSGSQKPVAPLRLGNWLPYRLFVVAAQVARPLEAFYSERFGLTQAAWRILAVNAERTGANATEIGLACALDPFTVSRGIGQLVTLGFARRTAAKNDRRFASVTITAKGRAAFDEIAALGIAIERNLLATLSNDETRVLDAALRKLENASARIEAGDWRALVGQRAR